MKLKNILIKTTVFLTLFLSFHQLNAQIITEADTLLPANEVETEEVHSPRKASIYSAVLPGLGQAYNKKYWKIPIIYIGFGAIGYFIDWNNDNYQFNKTAYRHLTDDDETTNAFLEVEAVQYYDLDNPTSFNNFKDGLNRRQDYYRRNRDLLIIGMVAFYGLNIIDASVDAHLFNFDISDDLTFDWQPVMQQVNAGNVYCINCTFNF